jgi:hypothetical protein
LGRLEGAAERIKVKDKWPAHHLDTMALIGTLRDRLAAARVEPKPLFGFIKKTGEKSRLLVKVHPEDRILHKALLKVVERPPGFSGSSLFGVGNWGPGENQK